MPLADVTAYSIDDSSTIEVDDAPSVSEQDGDCATIGIHIAAPVLAVTSDSYLHKLARSRMSTVYIPGLKIPMLPAELISAFSLDAGQAKPALSLYVKANIATGELLSWETRLERINVRENLRHDTLDAVVTEEALDDPDSALPYGEWLRPLWRLAQHLSAQRDRSEEHTSELQSLMRISYAVF